MHPAIALLADLVAIPSVNPSLVPGASGEAALAEHGAAWMRRHGIDVEIEEVVPGRSNVVGVIESRRPGATLLLCGHLDTVGTDGMDAPFTPETVDGRMYGRGAQDMKAGIAAILHAAARIADRGGLPAGRLVVALVIDEEYASAGADALAARWRADAAVIAEPTALAIGIAHKGFSAAEIVVRGRAAHGSRPAEGIDAIMKMGAVLAQLDLLGRRVQGGGGHRLLGTGSLHASTIDGGTELSTYPARCRLQVERRMLPGEALTIAADELSTITAELSHDDPQFRSEVRLLLARPGYELPPTHWLPVLLGEEAGAGGVDVRCEGLSYWTDAAILAAAGIPTVLFGPTGDGLHGPREWVDVESVVTCTRVLEAVAARACVRPGGG
jgi:acetylornithine deacetylase